MSAAGRGASSRRGARASCCAGFAASRVETSWPTLASSWRMSVQRGQPLPRRSALQAAGRETRHLLVPSMPTQVCRSAELGPLRGEGAYAKGVHQ